ncbi:MAG: dihydrodipicolinate synthase family protein [Acidobacteriota bacterium]
MSSPAPHLAGILPPITTPFDDRGALDLGALAANVESYNEMALTGYVAFGSNGEAVHLSSAERRQVLATLRRCAAPGRVVVAGVHEQSTLAAIRATRQAADAGADVALVITPYFYQSAMSQDVLQRFFVDVADEAPLPLLVYNIPQNTGVAVSPQTLAQLAEHPNIIGVKDSSGNQGALSEVLRRTARDFVVLVGNAGILYPALMMGAAGGILAVACVAPGACLELVDRVRQGDHAGARELQHRLAPLASLVTVELGIPGLKIACDLAGFQGGVPRAPLLPLVGQRERIARVMHESGFFEGSLS